LPHSKRQVIRGEILSHDLVHRRLPAGAIPDLEAFAGASDGRLAREARVTAHDRRHHDAPLRVQLTILRRADEPTLNLVTLYGGNIQGVDGALFLLPDGQRIAIDASFEAAYQHDALRQRHAKLRGNGDAPLGIDAMLILTTKHSSVRLVTVEIGAVARDMPNFPTFPHFAPLTS